MAVVISTCPSINSQLSALCPIQYDKVYIGHYSKPAASLLWIVWVIPFLPYVRDGIMQSLVVTGISKMSVCQKEKRKRRIPNKNALCIGYCKLTWNHGRYHFNTETELVKFGCIVNIVWNEMFNPSLECLVSMWTLFDWCICFIYS